MVMSNKLLSRGKQLAQNSDMKKEKKQQNNQTADLKQTQRRIHNPMKHQSRIHLQKQSTVLSR